MTAFLPLPAFAAQSLDHARSLAGFLRASGFAGLTDWPLFAAGADQAAALGLYAAARSDQGGPIQVCGDQGLTGWLRAQIAAVHSSAAFDAHAALCRASRPDLAVPRLRSLLPALPGLADLRADLFGTIAQVLTDGASGAEQVLAFYLDPARFAEALGGLGRDEALAALFQAQMPALLRVIDQLPPPGQAEGDMRGHLAGLIRQASRHFHDTRFFARGHALAQRLVAGGQGAADPGLLDELWYGAFRLGQLAEAEDWLAQWACIRPLQKRPLVYRALVTAVQDKDAACRLLELAGAADGRSTIPGNVLFAEYSLQQGRLHAAELAIRRACDLAQAGDQKIPQDYMVALHNILTAQGQKTDALQDLFQRSDLRLSWDSFGLDSVQDSTPLPQSGLGQGARVVVVMTIYNAEAHLHRAVEGVLAQHLPQGGQLTLILVDDCSQDASAKICDTLAGDPRIVTLRTPRNIGTYAAKNLGIARALDMGCDYIALCDSDDFWLRTHVARHLDAMQADDALQCSTSQWIRVRSDGTVEAGLRGRYVETCPHSTFLRAGVFDRAGFFDAVRFGADREFLRRIAVHFGAGSIGNIPAILTLGRRHAQSLTQSGAGAISEFNDSPQRLAYWQAWNDWHLAEAAAGRLPRIEAAPQIRAFAVNPDMLP